MVIILDIVSLQERGKYQGFLGAAVALGSALASHNLSEIMTLIITSSWLGY
jgi:hypothetical protein